MKKSILPLLALAALALPVRAALPRPTAANFSYGAKLTVAGYTTGKPALTGFPVLVRIAANSPSGFSYSDMQNANAADWDDIDLAFIDMLGNGLPFEIDTWNPSGESLVWVRLPTMQNGTEFVMCWGSTASGRDVCADKPWADYVGVWHMNETGGKGVTIHDATANALDGITPTFSKIDNSTCGGDVADGKIGTARLITKYTTNTAGDPYDSGIVVSLDTVAKLAAIDSLIPQFTASMWIRPQNTTGKSQWNYLITQRQGDKDPGWGVQFDLDSNAFSPLRIYAAQETDNGNMSVKKQNDTASPYGATALGDSPGISKSAWSKLDVFWTSDGSFAIYVNGSQVSSNALANGAAPINNGLAKFCIGGALAVTNRLDKAGRGFYGDMDEVRLRPSVPSDDWIAADYATQSDVDFLSPDAAEEYIATDDPIASISIEAIQYTNATVSVAVNSIGTGASSATLHVEFAEDDAFATIVKSENVTVSGSGYYNVLATDLDFGTAYYVRGSITNNQDRGADLGPLSFATLMPGSPAGTGILVPPGYTTLGATATASGFGKDAESATMWLEASTAADFATVATGSSVNATVGVATDLSVSGLSPDTAYNLRVRIRNDWGLETIVPLPSTRTRAEPFAATGLVFSEGTGGTIDFTFPVTAVYDGATVEAVLTYNGNGAGTQTTGVPATLSWTGVAGASGTATATVVATATLPNGGGTFTKTWTVSVVPGATSTVVSDVSTYASAAGALWVRPGDVVILPELVGAASYKVLNERFASLDGNALRAVEPGIVGIRCVDANYATNIMGVVILPEAIGSGSIYVFDETKANSSYDWARPECWKKVGSASNDSFPQNADDIAILPFFNDTDRYVRHRADFTIGGLYVGYIRPDVSRSCVLERYKDDTMKTITFQRTDGNPVRVQVCPNGENGKQTYLVFGGYDIDVVWASDAVIDGGSSETDLNGPRGRVKVHNTQNAASCFCTNTLQGVTLTIQGLPGISITSNYSTDIFRGVWRGTGEIVKQGLGGISFNGEFSGFSGTVREMSWKNLGDRKAPAAGVLMRAAGASNVTAHVYGFGAYSGSSGAMSYDNALGRGALGTGGSGVLPELGAQGPAKGLYLHGGTYRANAIDKSGWGVGGKDEKIFDVLSVGAGLSYISLETGKGNGSGKPINAVTAKTLAQTDKGTLVIYDNSCNSAPGTDVTNVMFSVREWADHAVGAAADPLASDVYPIIPWIVFNRSSDFNNISFATFDASGRLVKSYSENTEIDAVTSEDSNAYVSGKSINRNAATKPNLVMRSLFLNDSGKTRTLGAGRTLAITSGGLVLHGGGSSIGLPSGGEDNGALVLGDETHPAYVYAKSYGNEPNQIWATTTAAGGFVKSWTGNLVLGGNQTGIAVEIAVNGGSLQLGTDAKDCELAEGLPIRVCAGAKLKLPFAGTVANNPLKIDGSGGAFGTVELPVDQTCDSLALRDVFESDAWTTLPAGTYGASGSGAEFVRDDLFVGTGTLTVGDVSPTDNMMLLIW